MMGAHVGPPRSHTTGRTHDLSFRAGTALFGHLGIEWDLSSTSPSERLQLAEWVALYKTIRNLLATGTMVHADHPDQSLWLHGVVAPDASQAVYCAVATASGPSAPPVGYHCRASTRAGLTEWNRYPLATLSTVRRYESSAWWGTGATIRGSVLASAGVQIPALHPEQLVLIQVTAADAG